jgi:hypothetical protein
MTISQLPADIKLDPHYVMDRNGKTTAVQLSPEDYKQVAKVFSAVKRFRKNLTQMERVMAIHTGIKEALNEVAEVEAGKRPAKTLREVLDAFPR